jgi:trigger factor
VGHELSHRAQDLAMRLQAQGLTAEQWLAITGRSTEQMQSELREAAEVAARVDLALRAVAEAEGLECTDDDIDEELSTVADRVGESVSRVRAEFERGGNLTAVRSDVRKRKALDWLLERVEIVDEDGRAIDRADFEVTPDSDNTPQPDQPDPADETDANENTETESDAR